MLDTTVFRVGRTAGVLAALVGATAWALAACGGSHDAPAADGGPDGTAVHEAGLDAWIDCGFNDPACESVSCNTGGSGTCSYANSAGGCGVCTCGAGGNTSSDWTCSAGTQGCPLTLPVNDTACGPLQSGLPQGGVSCFYPQDAGSVVHGNCLGHPTIFCNCMGDPQVQDAGIWVCGTALCDDDGGGAETGTDSGADAGSSDAGAADGGGD
jgi:hypothetical protein